MPLELDQRWVGPSPRELLRDFPDQMGVPLYWMEATPTDQLVQLEAEDAVSTTRFDLTLQHDPSRESWGCAPGPRASWGTTYVPVIVTLSAEDGFEAAFEAYVAAANPDAVGARGSPSLTWAVPGLPMETSTARTQAFPWASPGFAQFALDAEGRFSGHFLHPDRGRALWPTACGGIVQAPSEESPFDAAEPPSVMLASGETLALSTTVAEEDLPALAISMTTRDPTACYITTAEYRLDLDVRIETDGAVFSGTVSGGARWTPTGAWFAYWPEVCGDISGSPAWMARMPANSADTELCVGGEITVTSDGRSLIAEAILPAAAKGWSYTAASR